MVPARCTIARMGTCAFSCPCKWCVRQLMGRDVFSVADGMGQVPNGAGSPYYPPPAVEVTELLVQMPHSVVRVAQLLHSFVMIHVSRSSTGSRFVNSSHLHPPTKPHFLHMCIYEHAYMRVRACAFAPRTSRTKHPEPFKSAYMIQFRRPGNPAPKWNRPLT